MLALLPAIVSQDGQAQAARHQTAPARPTALVAGSATTRSRSLGVRTAEAPGWAPRAMTRACMARRRRQTLATASVTLAGPARAATQSAATTVASLMRTALVNARLSLATRAPCAKCLAVLACLVLTARAAASVTLPFQSVSARPVGQALGVRYQTAPEHQTATTAAIATQRHLVSPRASRVRRAGWAPLARSHVCMASRSPWTLASACASPAGTVRAATSSARNTASLLMASVTASTPRLATHGAVNCVSCLAALAMAKTATATAFATQPLASVHVTAPGVASLARLHCAPETHRAVTKAHATRKQASACATPTLLVRTARCRVSTASLPALRMAVFVTRATQASAATLCAATTAAAWMVLASAISRSDTAVPCVTSPAALVPTALSLCWRGSVWSLSAACRWTAVATANATRPRASAAVSQAGAALGVTRPTAPTTATAAARAAPCCWTTAPPRCAAPTALWDGWATHATSPASTGASTQWTLAFACASRATTATAASCCATTTERARMARASAVSSTAKGSGASFVTAAAALALVSTAQAVVSARRPRRRACASQAGTARAATSQIAPASPTATAAASALACRWRPRAASTATTDGWVWTAACHASMAQSSPSTLARVCATPASLAMAATSSAPATARATAALANASSVRRMA